MLSNTNVKGSSDEELVQESTASTNENLQQLVPKKNSGSRSRRSFHKSKAEEKRLVIFDNIRIPFDVSEAKAFLVEASLRTNSWKSFVLLFEHLWLSPYFFLIYICFVCLWNHQQAFNDDCVSGLHEFANGTMRVVCLHEQVNPAFMQAIPSKDVIIMCHYRSTYFTALRTAPLGLYVYDYDNSSARLLWPVNDQIQYSDYLFGDPSCISPPWPSFEPQGISAIKADQGNMILGVVGFSRPNNMIRHAVEFFMVNGDDAQSLNLTWMGCFPLFDWRIASDIKLYLDRTDRYTLRVLVSYYGSTGIGKFRIGSFKSELMPSFFRNFFGSISFITESLVYFFNDHIKKIFEDSLCASLAWVGYFLSIFQFPDSNIAEYHLISSQSAFNYNNDFKSNSIDNIFYKDGYVYYSSLFMSEVCKVNQNLDITSKKCLSIDYSGVVEGMTYWPFKKKFAVVASKSFFKEEWCTALGYKICNVPWAVYFVDIEFKEARKVFEHDGSLFGGANSIASFRDKLTIGSRNTDRVVLLSINSTRYIKDPL